LAAHHFFATAPKLSCQKLGFVSFRHESFTKLAVWHPVLLLDPSLRWDDSVMCKLLYLDDSKEIGKLLKCAAPANIHSYEAIFPSFAFNIIHINSH
jgi:hypothetical protein